MDDRLAVDVIDEGLELRPAELDCITALRAPQIRALLDTGAFQLSLFDERDLAEITAPEFPGERLVVCKNPLLAEERARKHEDSSTTLIMADPPISNHLAGNIMRSTASSTIPAIRLASSSV